MSIAVNYHITANLEGIPRLCLCERYGILKRDAQRGIELQGCDIPYCFLWLYMSYSEQLVEQALWIGNRLMLALGVVPPLYQVLHLVVVNCHHLTTKPVELLLVLLQLTDVPGSWTSSHFAKKSKQCVGCAFNDISQCQVSL